MFVGHYAASLALKWYEPRVSLGVLFLGVQFVDILFFPLAMIGIEQLEIVEGYTAATHFALPFMPYTHSLLATLCWGGLFYVLFRWPARHKGKGAAHRVALVVALSVMSHWFLDLLVHTPDLPILGDNSPKLGLGLWNNAWATFALEAALLGVGLWLYLSVTRARNKIGSFGIILFVLFMVLINVVNVFGPLTATDVNGVAWTALASYFVLAAVAFWLDGKRTRRSEPTEVPASA